MVQMSIQRAATISPPCSLSLPFDCVSGTSRRFASCRSQYSCFAYSERLSPNVLKTNSVVDPSEPKILDASSSASRTGQYSATTHLSGTIGVMGISASSSLRFLQKLVHWSTRDGEEAPPFLVCNDPLLKKELMSSQNSQRPSDCNTALGKLRLRRLLLEKSGVCCIAMPCNTLHAYHDEISQGCSVPSLHIGDCVVKELKSANLKPVEYGSNVCVGILCTDNTLNAKCYLNKLESQVRHLLFGHQSSFLQQHIYFFFLNKLLYI
jgi:aspartate/glutamate racemase